MFRCSTKEIRGHTFQMLSICPTGACCLLELPCGVPNKMLTVQDRWTWCCWVMIMAKGVRARPTSSSAWVRETSVLRKIRSTTMPKSRTFRPTVSAYSLQLFQKQKCTETRRDTGAVWNENAQLNIVLSSCKRALCHRTMFNKGQWTYFCALLTTITEQSTGRSVS